VHDGKSFLFLKGKGEKREKNVFLPKKIRRISASSGAGEEEMGEYSRTQEGRRGRRYLAGEAPSLRGGKNKKGKTSYLLGGLAVIKEGWGLVQLIAEKRGRASSSRKKRFGAYSLAEL